MVPVKVARLSIVESVAISAVTVPSVRASIVLASITDNSPIIFRFSSPRPVIPSEP